MKSWHIWALIAVVTIGAGLWIKRPDGSAQPTGMVAVKVPALSPVAERGRVAFNANCQECHGANGGGSGKGPPLVHDIYNPGHHGDGAFVMAARRGVRSHHWNFGDMPPRPEASDADLADIIRYVRELQAANGIVARPHRM